MADVWVARDALRDGDLPAICVVTGEPTDDSATYRFESFPEWMWVLLVAGFFPFFIVLYFLKDEVEGRIPIRPEVLRAHHRRRTLGLGVAVAGAVTALAGLALGAPGAAVGAATGLFLAGAALWLVTFRSFVDGRLDRTRTWVKLSRVHPTFATHVAAWGRTPAGRSPVVR